MWLRPADYVKLSDMLNWDEIVRRSNEGNATPPRRVSKTVEEWRELLDPEVFRVTRHAGTERPFSSKMCGVFEAGEYHCACCETLLFDSSSKFDSKTGWPSFSAPAAENVVAYINDSQHGMTRIEATCAVCDAHLGHAFPDGPPPTNLRYCMNAVALVKA